MPISIEQLNVSYPETPHQFVLQDIAFHLADGSCTLLVGQTGCGKSTLLDAISGLIPSQSGRILLDGRQIWADSRQVSKSARLRIGHVFQSPDHQLFATTVEKEFAYSLRPFKLDVKSRQIRTTASLKTFELGLDFLAKSPLILSGGQKRRVAVATTDATAPEWLLLDEPTAGLDSAAISHLSAWLKRWKGRMRGGVVIATHDIDALLPCADNVILMQDGRIEEFLSADDLASHPYKLRTIGIALPERLQILHELRAMNVPSFGVTSAQFASAREVAGAIIAWKAGIEAGHGAERFVSDNFSASKSSPPSSESDYEKKTHIWATESTSTTEQRSAFWGLDARAKWIGSFLLCLALLLQPHGWQTFVGLFIAFCVVSVVRLPLHSLWKITKPVLILALISIFFSSLTLQPASHLPFHLALSGNAARTAFYGFLQIYAVLMIGLLLPATTSQLALKEALARILRPLAWLHIPVEAIALTASLTLRFVPLIMRQFQRFSKISQARGKRQVRPGKIAWRDFPATFIPLILSLLQYGEDVSIAMEARGYDVQKVSRGVHSSESSKTGLSKHDWIWIAVAVVLSVGLVALR